MDYLENSYPIPSDYFGVLWALAGIQDSKTIEHGSTGTAGYNNVNFGILNRLKPRGKLFSSGLDEDDVVMGREEKLISAVKEIDTLYQPKLISIVATGVTSIIGLDLNGIADDLEKDINAKILTFPDGGFSGSYMDGIEQVLIRLAHNIVQEPRIKKPGTVNIVGVTVDSFNNESDLHEIERLLNLAGIYVNTVFTKKTDVKAIEKMSEAQLNIVLNENGIEAAKILENRFGMPWLYSNPFGIKGTVNWLEQISDMLKIKIDKNILSNEIKNYGFTMSVFTSFLRPFDNLRIGISGSSEYIQGLSDYFIHECGLKVKLAIIKNTKKQDTIAKDLKQKGVEEVLVNPDYYSLKNSLDEMNLHILYGNSYELKTALKVPIKTHSAFPCFDYYNFCEGTPFVGFKGNAYLIQTLVNNVNQHPEVWRI